MLEGKRVLLPALGVGFLNGFCLGLIAEYCRRTEFEQAAIYWGDQPHYSIHLMDSIPHFLVPLLFAVVFAVMSVVVHRFLGRHLSSLILRWELIGFCSIAILLPVFFQLLIGMKRSDVPIIIGFTLFISTLLINLLFGWLLKRLSSHKQS